MNFVVIDLALSRSRPQQALIDLYYGGYIPHVAILDKGGRPLYNSAGEVEESTLAPLLDAALK